MTHVSTRWRLWCSQTMLGWWCLGTLIICAVLVLCLYGLSLLSVSAGELEDTTVMLVVVVSLILSFAYGVFRVAYYHPLFHLSYGEWLLGQPWAPRQPLPLGPWHFVWQDAIFLGVLTSLVSLVSVTSQLFIPHGSEPGMSTWLMPLGVVVGTFVITYASLVMLKATFLCEPVGAYSFAFFVGALALVWMSTYYVGAYFLGLIFAAHVSSRRMLDRLELSFTRQKQRSSIPSKGLFSAPGIWPFDDLLETTASPLIPLRHALIISFLAAWATWSWANLYPSVLAHFDQELPTEMVEQVRHSTWVALCGLAGMLAAWRFLIYWSVGTWPFGLLARLKLGQLIVPGFDIVLVSPLIVVAIGVALPPILLSLQVPSPLVAGATVLLISLALLGLGPTLDTWRHVGQHRMRDRSRDRRTKVSTQ